MKSRLLLSLSILCLPFLVSCDDSKSSDTVQQDQQETMLMDATKSVGMPAIKNWRERRELKDILEKRDSDTFITYSYILCPMNGKFIFIGQSIGYPIPYSTQYTNPSKIEYNSQQNRQGFTYQVLPQADPNSLFSPSSADATWVMLINPTTGKAEPQYIEDKVEAFTFQLPANMLNR